MFLSSGNMYVQELLELHQWRQGPFQSTRGKVGFLLRCCSGKGPQLALRRESHGFSRVAAVTRGSSRVTTGNSGTPSCHLRKVQSSCELRGASRDTSPFGAGPMSSPGDETTTSVSLSSADMDLGAPLEFHRGVRPRLMWRHASPLSSPAVTVESHFLSS